MNSSTSIDDSVLKRLRDMSRAAAGRFDGLEADDFLSEAWLAYKESKDSGRPDSAAFTRAEYAITDAMERWIDTPKEYMLVDGDPVQQVVTTLPYYNRKTLRTKLPRKIKRLLDNMPERDRKVMYLTYMWNRTPREIALELGISDAIVYYTKTRALKNLQLALGVITELPRRVARKQTGRAPGAKMKSQYQVISPSGETYTITSNFKEFCERHELNYKAMREVVNPKATQKSHKGWTLLTTTSM